MSKATPPPRIWHNLDGKLLPLYLGHRNAFGNLVYKSAGHVVVRTLAQARQYGTREKAAAAYLERARESKARMEAEVSALEAEFKAAIEEANPPFYRVVYRDGHRADLQKWVYKEPGTYCHDGQVRYGIEANASLPKTAEEAVQRAIKGHEHKERESKKRLKQQRKSLKALLADVQEDAAR